jgi:hypothetical protein
MVWKSRNRSSQKSYLWAHFNQTLPCPPFLPENVRSIDQFLLLFFEIELTTWECMLNHHHHHHHQSYDTSINRLIGKESSTMDGTFRQRKSKGSTSINDDDNDASESDLNHGGLEETSEPKSDVIGDEGDPARVLSIWQFIGIGFFLTCGGCFGIEEAVGAAGPLWCLLGLFLLPVFFALPQAYITAELSSMIPENGGYVIWIQRAFGNTAAYLNAYNAMASALFDMAIYPVLFASYLGQLIDPTSVSVVTASSTAASASGSGSGIFVEFSWYIFIAKMMFVLFFMFLNIRGVEVVGVASYFLSAAIISPFILELFIGIRDLEPKVWVQTSEQQIDWPLLLSTLLWNFTGFDRFGTFAGEVGLFLPPFLRSSVFVFVLRFGSKSSSSLLPSPLSNFLSSLPQR